MVRKKGGKSVRDMKVYCRCALFVAPCNNGLFPMWLSIPCPIFQCLVNGKVPYFLENWNYLHSRKHGKHRILRSKKFFECFSTIYSPLWISTHDKSLLKFCNKISFLDDLSYKWARWCEKCSEWKFNMIFFTVGE